VLAVLKLPKLLLVSLSKLMHQLVLLEYPKPLHQLLSHLLQLAPVWLLMS